MDNDQRQKKDTNLQRKRIKVDFLIHDLKNPLIVIETGLTSLLKMQEKYGSLTGKQEKVLLRVLRNTKVTKSLVNDVLELGRSREGIFNLSNLKLSVMLPQVLIEIFDQIDVKVSEKIKGCEDFSSLQEALQEKGIWIFVDETLWRQEVLMDEVKIKQIFRNLLINALKYRKSRVELGVEKDEDYFIFSVKDDGKGIPQIYHQKVLESYFQIDPSAELSARGHGLGLAGVMVLLEDMGGKLTLESDEGKGAIFKVMVPLVNQ